jgi:hypothetical protein
VDYREYRQSTIWSLCDRLPLRLLDRSLDARAIVPLERRRAPMTEIGSRQEGQPANGYRERFESIGAFDRADLSPELNQTLT